MTLRAVFVDTGAWVALRYRRDNHHKRARTLLKRLRRLAVPLVTTDHVIAETVTLLKARGGVHHALALGAALLSGTIATLEEIDAARRKRAWQLFEKHQNLPVGFVDCTSFATMEELGLDVVFGFDDDFRAAGFTLYV